jgi:hypothetical protein
MFSSRSKIDILALLFALALGDPSATAAQVAGDSIKAPATDPTHAWISLGLGGGSSSSARRSSGGPIAGRAAVSVAVNPVVLFTLAGTTAGGYDSEVDSFSLLAGVKAPTGDGFFFFTVGGATTSCGRSCARQTGLALDAGLHIGEKQAGVGFAAFVIRAHRSKASGVVVTLDLGSFSR